MSLQNSFGLGRAGALDFWVDGGGLGRPAIGLWAKIVVRDVNIDGRDQFGDAGKAVFAHDVVGQLAREVFDQLHGREEVFKPRYCGRHRAFVSEIRCWPRLTQRIS